MECSNCNRKATYDCPKPLCAKHWTQWFMGPPPKKAKTLHEAIKQRQDALSALATARAQKPMSQTALLHWIAETAAKTLRCPRSKIAKLELKAALTIARGRPKLKKIIDAAS